MVTLARRTLLPASLVVLAAILLVGCAASTGSPGNSGGNVTVPRAPAGLAASPGNAQVSLSWSPSSGARSYHVKRSAVSGGPYTPVAAPSGTTYLDTSLTNGTKYFYVVSAANSAGESANSAEVNATPTAPANPPATPANLQAIAGNAQVSLAWSASTGATSYNVKRSATSGGPYAKIYSPATANYIDTSLTNGTKYFYVVSAVNSAGESANSAEVNATPTAPANPPPTPTNLQATAGNAQVSLTWSASTGATSYNVKRSTTIWRPLHQDLFAHYRHLHRHQRHQRHKIFLCCLRRKLRGRKRKFR